jgi:hypothetical protein
MPTFAQIAKSFKFDVDKALNKAFTPSNIQKWVLDTIKKRLYKDGITGSMQKLRTDKGNPYYTDAYVRVKKRIGERTSNVTLYQSGGFYDSFRFKLLNDGWSIDMQSGYLSVHFKNLYESKDKFEQDIASLTPKELDFLLENYIMQSIRNDIDEQILQNT